MKHFINQTIQKCRECKKEIPKGAGIYLDEYDDDFICEKCYEVRETFDCSMSPDCFCDDCQKNNIKMD